MKHATRPGVEQLVYTLILLMAVLTLVGALIAHGVKVQHDLAARVTELEQTVEALRGDHSLLRLDHDSFDGWHERDLREATIERWAIHFKKKEGETADD